MPAERCQAVTRGGAQTVKPRVRLRDVAVEAGVDASVVSRVLSGDSRLSVRAETRQRVLDAASRLDYRPNAAARTLKTTRTMAIGLLAPDVINYAPIAKGADERAREAGYTLFVAQGGASDLLVGMHGRIDGVLIGIGVEESPRVRDITRALPAVFVNRRGPSGVPSITVDDELGGALAARHLVELGHRRIGHIGGPLEAQTAQRRLRGYLGALAEAGIDANRDWIVHASFDEAGGHAGAALLLAGVPRPTGIFVSNVRAAIGAMAAARALGLRIPADVSIVGFDDTTFAPYLDPPLTTIRTALVEMGRQAVDHLLSLLRGFQMTDVVVGAAPELVVRASTAPRR
jgi:LacI family transcriptional regulator